MMRCFYSAKKPKQYHVAHVTNHKQPRSDFEQQAVENG